jgi:hypothetical protein
LATASLTSPYSAVSPLASIALASTLAPEPQAPPTTLPPPPPVLAANALSANLAARPVPASIPAVSLQSIPFAATLPQVAFVQISGLAVAKPRAPPPAPVAAEGLNPAVSENDCVRAVRLCCDDAELDYFSFR